MKKQHLFFSLIFSLILLFSLSSPARASSETGGNNQAQSSSNVQKSEQNKQSSQTSPVIKKDEQENNQEQKQNRQNSTLNSSSNNTNTETNKPVAKKTTKKVVKKTLPSGWRNKNGKRYYLHNGKVTKGLKQINKDWYLFDKNGAMLKDVRKIPHTNSYGYFDNQGKRRFTNTNTGRAYYWINKSGKITGIKNNANVVCQRPNMPTGCEITAVTMLLNFAGVKVTKEQAARIMPRGSNPNKGFIGSPYKEFPLGFWVAPGGVKPVIKHYLGTAKIMTGSSLSSIKKKLLRSHLVVVWMGWFDGFSNHALTLTGYHGNTLYYNDPWTGTKRAMNTETFLHHWSLDGHRAISY